MPTPIQLIGGVHVKRDDLCEFAGVNGAKVRVIRKLAQGASGIITAGPRASSQIYIAARVAAAMGIPCRCHVPQGATTPHMEDALAHGAEIVRHKAGYNNVLQARAEADHKTHPERALVPLWLRCPLTVEGTRRQCVNVPHNAKRAVVVAGSGMTLAGVLWGLRDLGLDIPVVGVMVGADPTKTLDTFAGFGWWRRCNLVESPLDYKGRVEGAFLGDIALDPGYEAKCLQFLEPGDLFWVAGNRIIT